MAHVVGLTGSTNFQAVAGWQGTNAGGLDAFATGIRVASGAIEYATYLGGGGDDEGYRVGVGDDGRVWMAGVTFSTNLPVVASISSTNSGGSDGWLARWTADGRTLEMSSYFGGSANDSFWDIHVGGAGWVHLTGATYSMALPGLSTNSPYSTNQGLSDILIVRLAADGSPTTSLHGSTGDDLGYGVTSDTAGNTYVAGLVRSVAIPVSGTNVAQAVYGGGVSDGFVLKLAYEPTLTAEMSGDGIRLSWPAPNDGFVLEAAPSVGTAGPWVREVAPVTTEDMRHSVQLPMTATNCVFRLRWVR